MLLLLTISFVFFLQAISVNTISESFTCYDKNIFQKKNKDFQFSFDKIPLTKPKVKLIGNNILLHNNRVVFNDKVEFDKNVNMINKTIFDNDVFIDGTLQFSALEDDLIIDEKKFERITKNVEDIHNVFTPYYEETDEKTIKLTPHPNLGGNKCVNGLFKMLKNNENFDAQDDLNNDEGICNSCCKKEEVIYPIEHTCKISMIKSDFNQNNNDDEELTVNMSTMNKIDKKKTERNEKMQYIYLYKSRPDTQCELRLHWDDEMTDGKVHKQYTDEFKTQGNLVKINPDEFANKKKRNLKYIDGISLKLLN